ncbi:hypothetical protein APA_571 [Pseudanabaena sp. lw0831]|nr:hypothetical protein APA_571 [Pseudanabaena sp. lw0831]
MIFGKICNIEMSDRKANNHITRRSLFAKSKTAITLIDVKQMLGL